MDDRRTPAPPLELAQVRLRDYHDGDLAALAEQLAPHRAWHRTNGPYFGAMTEDDVRSVLSRTRAEMAVPVMERPVPRERLAIVDPVTDRLLGEVTWYWESRETDWRRLGVVVREDSCRGRGIGTTALRLWTAYLFATTDALRLDLATYSGNPAMIRAATKAGYVEEGRMRRARRWSGGVHDAVVLGTLREEWQEREGIGVELTPR